MGLMRTRIEVDLQLGGRCFHLGRKLIVHDADSLPGKFLLNETVELLTEVSRIEQRLPENVRRAYHGQIATSLAILSRRTDPGSVEDILRKAGHHSQIAEELGDYTEEHFAYRAEIDLRLFGVTRDESILEQAQRAIRKSPSFQAKKLRAVSADVTAELRFSRIRNGDFDTGLRLLRDAEHQYADALTADVPDDVQDGYLLAKRAQDRFREALSYLAAFHAWRSMSDPKVARGCSKAHKKSFNIQLSRICRRLQLTQAHSTLLADAFAPFLTEGSLMLAKKDPHSGNWLWTAKNELVMIDIESTAVLPLLQEVAVLIDDLPLVDVTEQGWEYRYFLCHEYLESLGRFGFTGVEREDREDRVDERYQAAVILHVMRGMNRLRGTDSGVSSFSIESRMMQREHYTRLLDYLASNAAQREVRKLAGALAIRA
jgi:hypothetical protein